MHYGINISRTFHFGVWLPFVVPSPEGFAVVLCALLSSEVHSVGLAWFGVTQLVQSTGALAELAIVLWAWVRQQTISTANMEAERERKREEPDVPQRAAAWYFLEDVFHMMCISIFTMGVSLWVTCDVSD